MKSTNCVDRISIKEDGANSAQQKFPLKTRVMSFTTDS